MTAEPIDWREQVANRLDTFTESVEWIGGSADLAFADSIRALAEYAVRVAIQDVERRLLLDLADEATVLGRRGPNAVAEWLIDKAVA